MHMRRAEVNLRCHFSGLIALCSEAGSFIQLGWLAMKPRDLLVSTSPLQRFEMCAAALGFLCGFWGSNSGLHGHGVSAAYWPSSVMVVTLFRVCSHKKVTRNKPPAAKIARLTFALPLGILWSLRAQLSSMLPYPRVRRPVQMSILSDSE